MYLKKQNHNNEPFTFLKQRREDTAETARLLGSLSDKLDNYIEREIQRKKDKDKDT